MNEQTSYASAPDDIKEAAQQIASTYDFDRAVLSGAICAAILAERERCAKIADGMFDKLYGEPGLQDSVERALLMRIANAMRGHQP